ncbi:MAG TPA: hypothetical protein VMF03_12460 [Steroidobacteraceae bacterium]|nr:hypothetical protein [Steroidobacteraceae bacterium]
MKTLQSVGEFASAHYLVCGHWQCGHAHRIDLERIVMVGLEDLPLSSLLRAVRCPTCGHAGPADPRLTGPISDQVRAQQLANADERQRKVVPLKRPGKS